MNYKYLIFHLNRFGSPSGHDHSYHRIATGDENWDWFHTGNEDWIAPRAGDKYKGEVTNDGVVALADALMSCNNLHTLNITYRE